MKFDFIIGNPPYQESQETNNKAEAIYHYFYDNVSEITDRYMLISPARFLFNAGLTPKVWNKKMLSDNHLKVVKYYSNSADVFNNVNINGGVAIIYRDKNQNFGAINNFIPFDVLRKLAEKFKTDIENTLSSIIYGGRSELKFNETFISEYPDIKERILATIRKKHPSISSLGPNEEYEIKSSSFERTPFVFYDNDPCDGDEYYKILGIESGKRVFKWIKRKYLSPRFPERNNIKCFKIFISNADGAAGQIGKPIPARILGKPMIAHPYESSIPTFMPLQDFTPNSDIDWTKSVADIDRQLYAKYGLDESEIEFIETHVKEME